MSTKYILLKPLATIVQENTQSFYPSESFRISHFTMRHPVVSLKINDFKYPPFFQICCPKGSIAPPKNLPLCEGEDIKKYNDIIYDEYDEDVDEAVKGQLSSKCPYEKSVLSKIPTKIFPRFLPQLLRRGQIKKNKGTLLY